MSEAAALLGVSSILYSAFTGSEAEKRQAQAAEARGEFAASVLERNAMLEEEAAADAIRRGGTEANRLETAAKGVVGSQQVAYGSQGVDVTYGTPAEVQADTYKAAGIDSGTIRENAYKEAMGLRTSAEGLRREAKFAKMKGAGEGKALRDSAGATLVTGGLQATERFLDYYDRKRQTRTALRSR